MTLFYRMHQFDYISIGLENLIFLYKDKLNINNDNDVNNNKSIKDHITIVQFLDHSLFKYDLHIHQSFEEIIS